MITIGTSGYSYKHWHGPFYAKGERDEFAHFIKHFNSVELNNTFYGYPRDTSISKWYERAPSNFVYAVKANQLITHRKKLKAVPEALDFLRLVSGLKEKLGPILFQLPPMWNVNVERLESFLKELPTNHTYTFEFRNRTWHTEEVYKVLRKYNAGFCIYDFDFYMSEPILTSKMIYLRFHGPRHPYADSYSNEFLENWAAWAVEKHRNGFDVFCYYDNDNRGYAVKNALYMREQVEKLTEGSNTKAIEPVLA